MYTHVLSYIQNDSQLHVGSPSHPQKKQKRNPDWFNLSYFTSSKTNYVVANVVIADLALAR